MTWNPTQLRIVKRQKERDEQAEAYAKQIESVETRNGIRITRLKPGIANGAETAESWQRWGSRLR